MLDRIQRPIALNLLPNRTSKLLLIVLDIAVQLCFCHDFPELHLRLAILPLQLHPTLAPDHLVNVF